MTSTTAPTPADLMRRYLAAAQRGDFVAAFALVAEDVTIRIPGRSPLAGVRYGREAALDYICTIVAMLDDGGAELVAASALSNDEQFVLIVTEELRRNGETYRIPRANAYRVDDGQIVEITIYEGDQYLVDALLTEALDPTPMPHPAADVSSRAASPSVELPSRNRTC